MADQQQVPALADQPAQQAAPAPPAAAEAAAAAAAAAPQPAAAVAPAASQPAAAAAPGPAAAGQPPVTAVVPGVPAAPIAAAPAAGAAAAAAAGAPPAAAAAPPAQTSPVTEASAAAEAEAAKLKFQEMGAKLLFEKVLTTSDANGTGRIVIPKGQAEAHLPPLDAQSGTTLQLVDTLGKKHAFRFRFWINNQSRMYLLENTQDVQTRYNLQVGDVLVFGKLPDGTYVVMGRPGTKDDLVRKMPAKRTASDTPGPAAAAATREAAKKAAPQKPRQPVESLKSKRIKQKQAMQQVQSVYTYWSGYSLPPRRDGIFRAVPNSAAQEGDKVVAQYGYWTAIVSLGGEMYQAFFETFDAATAAFEAARQDAAAFGAGAAAK